MKTLSIRQPWASLICSGMKDIENRTWKPAQVPCRILIHASSTKVPKSWPQKFGPFFYGKLSNAIDFGWIPPVEEMPTSAIIGYVDVVGITTESDSLWADEECQQWILENPHLFDEPILDVKGKLNLFEYDLDENNLPPAHQIHLIKPRIEGDKYIVTFTDEVMTEQWNDWQEFQEGDDMLFYDSDDMANITDENDNQIPIKEIVIRNESGTKVLHFEVTNNGYWVENEGTEEETWSIIFSLGKKLD